MGLNACVIDFQQFRVPNQLKFHKQRSPVKACCQNKQPLCMIRCVTKLFKSVNWETGWRMAVTKFILFIQGFSASLVLIWFLIPTFVYKFNSYIILTISVTQSHWSLDMPFTTVSVTQSLISLIFKFDLPFRIIVRTFVFLFWWKNVIN